MGRLPEETTEGIPVLFEQCLSTYNYLHEAADDDPFEEFPIYKGYITRELEEHVGITISQYSRVIKLLVSMECVAQLKRGSAFTQSEWYLLKEPDLETFNTIRERQNRKNNVSYKRIQQRINDVLEVVNDMVDELARVREDVKELQEAVYGKDEHGSGRTGDRPGEGEQHYSVPQQE